VKLLSAISFRRSLMNPHSEIADNNNNKNKTRTKAKAAAAAIPMAGIIVAAALMSGLAMFSTYTQPALAQQNMTGSTTGGNATGGTTSGRGTQSSACTPTQTAEGGGGTNQTSSGGATGGSTTNATNATSASTSGGGNQSSVGAYIEQACMALQNNDTQGAMMQLNLALMELSGSGGGGTQGGNITSTTGGGTETGSTTTGDGTTGGAAGPQVMP
jgi:hypothetical protein